MLLVCSVIILLSGSWAQDYSCYDFNFQPRVCLPGPEKIARQRVMYVTPNMTCGTPANRYCRIAQPSGCYVCNSTSELEQHPASYLTDKDYPSKFWWQSVTWWDARQSSLLVDNKLKAKLTLSMNKTYDLTGLIKVAFHSSKPHAFIFEKSSDYGLTWTPYRYFADDCQQKFPNVSKIVNVKSTSDIYCIEDKSVTAAQGSEVVFQPHFVSNNFWSNSTQNYLRATDFRISLEYPWTDGNEIIQQEPFLNKYYYDVSDVQVNGRCHCNGHAPYCHGSSTNEQKCFCQHNTDGIDCEKCLPLYNNKPWKSAESPTKPNPCEACTCNNHSSSCYYNATVGFGVCDACLHGTTGYHCDRCDDFYFRNISTSILNQNACIACDCFLDGVLDDGTCIQNATDGQNIGQCSCKPNVIGRKCDECELGFFGLETGNCSACNCSLLGTMTNLSKTCNQKTGQCSCKNTTGSKMCSQCKPGFYNFPVTANEECGKCICNVGGAVNDICNRVTGECVCRTGVYGRHCNETIPGRFFPLFDHYKMEAESGTGSFQIMSAIKGTDNNFTGFGYAIISKNESVEVTLNCVDFTGRYFIVLRYGKLLSDTEIMLNLSYNNESVSFPLIDERITIFNGTSTWQRKNATTMVKGANYTVRLTSNTHHALKVDSVVVMLDYTSSKLHADTNYLTKHLISSCWKDARKVNQSKSERCEMVTFSSTVEWFNGTIECNCDDMGSMNVLTCDAYGGQCLCKPGVMGRRCDQCEPGYFNFTSDGCQACSCNTVGSIHLVCNASTGQCKCKHNVTSRTCNKCIKDYYGFGTDIGCQDCICNTNGSLSSQCQHTGQCLCHNSTIGAKCEQCRENYYNFTENGCSRCRCNKMGSIMQQCDFNTGVCPCKENVNLENCSTCKSSFFNLNQNNPKGCQECFCSNKTSKCVSADGYQELIVPFVPVEWHISNKYGGVVNNCVIINATDPTSEVSLPASYTRNLLYSFHKHISLEIQFAIGSNFNFSLRFVTADNKSLSFLSTRKARNNNITVYDFHIVYNNTIEHTSLIELQNVLFNVERIDIAVGGTNNAHNFGICDAVLKSVEKLTSGPQVKGVERCLCPQSYSGNSCESCAAGYTREVKGSGPLGNCIPCMCNGRSQTCDPETGICSNCRAGATGDHCELCEPNVEGPDCLVCKRGYYGFENTDFAGCKSCDCVAKNTIAGVSNVCNVVTGQCPCKLDIGGRVCDRCAENSVNITNECKPCTECHRLIQEEVHTLRESIKELNFLSQNNTNTATLLSNTTLSNLLTNLTVSVMTLMSQANASVVFEQQVIEDLHMLNETLDVMETRLNSNISRDIDIIRSQVPSMLSYQNTSENLVNTTYRLLWACVYVINAEIKPNFEVIPRELTKLGQMASTFTDLSSEFETVYSPVLKDISLILNITTTAVNRIANASKIVNSTVDRLDEAELELSDLKTAFQPTEELVRTLLSDSETFLNSSISFLHCINKTLTDLLRTPTNQSQSALSDIAKKLIPIKIQLNELTNLFDKVNSSHSKIINSAMDYVNTSSLVLQAAQEKRTNSSKTIAQIYLARNIVENATNLANITHHTALQVLSVLNSFNDTARNASQLAHEALSMAVEVNKTNNVAIATIEDIRKSINTAVTHAHNAFNISTNVSDIISRQNELLDDLLNSSMKLENHTLLRTYNWNQSLELISNITNINESMVRTSKQCVNMTATAENSVASSKSALKAANQSLGDRNENKKRLDDLLVNIQSVNTLNQTSLASLQKSLKESRTLWDSLHVDKAVAALKESATSQQNYIVSYKQKIKSLRAEVNEMKRLHEAISGAEVCD